MPKSKPIETNSKIVKAVYFSFDKEFTVDEKFLQDTAQAFVFYKIAGIDHPHHPERIDANIESGAGAEIGDPDAWEGVTSILELWVRSSLRTVGWKVESGSDYECYCGKYSARKYKGITCDRCGWEVVRSEGKISIRISRPSKIINPIAENSRLKAILEIKGREAWVTNEWAKDIVNAIQAKQDYLVLAVRQNNVLGKSKPSNHFEMIQRELECLEGLPIKVILLIGY